uniref:Ig-like domain-containing protein n=1 Tax=Denticeps clupeoides TaxID=299321 RepID=A0AAY4ACN8_9TELE
MNRWVKTLLILSTTYDTVTQLEFQKIDSEGEMVKLSCGYKTTSSRPELLWYRQRTNDFPRFLLLRNEYSAGQNGTDLTERFHSNVDSDSKSAPLTIWNLQVSDSAVYYCALRKHDNKRGECVQWEDTDTKPK